MKNWDGVLESMEGRLKRWRCLSPSISFRWRSLIINPLLSSSQWHGGGSLPWSALTHPGSTGEFFLGWSLLAVTGGAVSPYGRYGGGLVHLASKGAAFQLQFIRRLLHGPQDLVWRPLTGQILQSVGGLGLQESVL